MTFSADRLTQRITGNRHRDKLTSIATVILMTQYTEAKPRNHE